MPGVDEGDRFPKPVTLFFGELGEKGEEVELVVRATVLGLVEEEDFRDRRGQAPGGLPDAEAKRPRNPGLSAEDPVAARALVNLDVEAETGLCQRVETAREPQPRRD